MSVFNVLDMKLHKRLHATLAAVAGILAKEKYNGYIITVGKSEKLPNPV